MRLLSKSAALLSVSALMFLGGLPATAEESSGTDPDVTRTSEPDATTPPSPDSPADTPATTAEAPADPADAPAVSPDASVASPEAPTPVGQAPAASGQETATSGQTASPSAEAGEATSPAQTPLASSAASSEAAAPSVATRSSAAGVTPEADSTGAATTSPKALLGSLKAAPPTAQSPGIVPSYTVIRGEHTFTVTVPADGVSAIDLRFPFGVPTNDGMQNCRVSASASTATCSFTYDTSRRPDGIYKLAVTVAMTDGTRYYSSASYTFDNTKPELSIDPADGSTVSGTRTFTLTQVEAHPGGMYLSWNGGEKTGYCFGEKTCALEVDTTTLKDGEYKLYVSAKDTAVDRNGETGNVSDPTTYTYTVKNGLPTPTITAPTENDVLTGATTVTGTLEAGALPNAKDLTVGIAPCGATGEPAWLASRTLTPTRTWSTDLDLSGVDSGTYCIYAVVHSDDALGYDSTVASVKVKVDNLVWPAKVTARSQCWSGEPVVAGYIWSTSTTTFDGRMILPIGSDPADGQAARKVASGGPAGAGTYFTVKPGGTEIAEGGTATFRLYVWYNSTGFSKLLTAPYSPVQCRPTPLAPTMTPDPVTCDTTAVSVSVPAGDTGEDPAVKGYLQDGKDVTGTTISLAKGEKVTIEAVLGEGRVAADGAKTSWDFEFTPPADCPKDATARDVTDVTPATNTEVCPAFASSDASFTLPDTEGVVYLVGPDKKEYKAGETVTVEAADLPRELTITARAAEGFRLTDPDWTHTLTLKAATDCETPPAEKAATPTAPVQEPLEITCDTESVTVTLPGTLAEGVTGYTDADGAAVTAPVSLAAGESITLKAVLAEGYTLAEGASDSWTFTFTPPADCPSQTPAPTPLEVTPAAPTQDPGEVTCDTGAVVVLLPDLVEGVAGYVLAGEEIVLDGPVSLAKGESVTIEAVLKDGYVLADDAAGSWTFDFTVPTDCPTTPPETIEVAPVAPVADPEEVTCDTDILTVTIPDVGEDNPGVVGYVDADTEEPLSGTVELDEGESLTVLAVLAENAELEAGADAAWSFDFTLPEDCTGSTPIVEPTDGSLSPSPSPTTPTGSLPFTGSGPLAWVLAAGIVLCGLGVFFATARRRAQLAKH